MITCGLVGPDEEGELALPHAFLEDMACCQGCSPPPDSSEDSADEMEALTAGAVKCRGHVSDHSGHSSSDSELDLADSRPSVWRELLEEHAKKMPKHPSFHLNDNKQGYCRSLLKLVSSITAAAPRGESDVPLEVEAMEDQEFLREMVASGLAKVTDEDGAELSPEAIKAMLADESVVDEVSLASTLDLPGFQVQLSSLLDERERAWLTFTLSRRYWSRSCRRAAGT
jgi:hypothetical protein